MKGVIILSLLMCQMAFGYNQYKNVKVPAKPGIDNNKKYDFKKTPVKFLEAIYMDHHFSSLDRGLKRVEVALKVINPIYKKDRNALFFPKKFKHAKAFEIKGTLHILKSLLLYKKGKIVTVETSAKDAKTFKKLMGKQKKMGGKLTAKDMALFAKIKSKSRDKAQGKMQNMLKQSIEQMEMAMKIDPNSPTAHYQYAKLMLDFVLEGDTALVEKHLYKAGDLSYRESDLVGLKKSISALKELNPKSSYLTKLEKLKGRK
jgi:hypothetical protein